MQNQHLISSFLPIQCFLFQDKPFEIYGTNEDPLFNCLDVAKILGYQEANHIWFYQ
jgi:prophage antirepressor-like protein